MSDFDHDQILSDWDGVIAVAGSLTATTGDVTFYGVWAQQTDLLSDLQEQYREEARYTVTTTYTELPTLPEVRQTVTRGGISYVIEAVRSDAEEAVIEFDCKKVI